VRKSLVACIVALLALEVVAAGFGLKAGLWEVHILNQTIDGKDMTAQINGAAAQMQKALANMPPEQRARMEAMMKEHGASMGAGDGTVRICISPEMANRDQPWVDPQGRCQPATVNRSGNHATFEFNCSSNGTTTSGKGESTVTGDVVASQVDATIHKANGETRVMHTETEMKFLGADCGDVKPIAPPSSTPPSSLPPSSSP